jgi:hypothetical protein
MPSWKKVQRPSGLINEGGSTSALRGEWKNYFN